MLSSDVNATHVSPDSRLQDIARALSERVRPELVLLFGSRAQGTEREDSDYDLMIVVRDPSSVEAARAAAYDALRALPLSVDVIARSVHDYRRYQSDPGFLDFMVARDGVLLYASGTVPQLVHKRVREEPSDQGGLAMWLTRAASDMSIAEQNLASLKPSVDAICFHAHAAVEKWLKASFVLQARTFPPRTHDLSDLLDQQPADIGASVAIRKACALLMALYPTSRYPEAGMPTLAEARLAVAAAQVVKDLVLPGLAE